MDEDSSSRSAWQRAVFDLYAGLHAGRLRRSLLGQWLFERAYAAYKLALEGGPIHSLAGRIHPGTSAIDVGANIGVFTLIFARAVRGPGRVIAIEPEPENVAALQRRIAASGLSQRIVLVDGVAADAGGTLYLHVNANHPGDHWLSDSGLPVRAVTLDSLVQETGAGRVSLIKIDVQGAEMRVLHGATDLLLRERPDLFIEIDEPAMRRQGTTPAALVDWLAQYGYAPYRLRRRSEPVPLPLDVVRFPPHYMDVLFLGGVQGTGP